MSAVSRETLAGGASANRRRYNSPRRTSVAEAKRAALIRAVLILAAEGNFRGTAQQLADLAGVRRQAICRYFGSVELLYRVVARERWGDVFPLLPFGLEDLGVPEKDAVWVVLVGKPRELS